MIPRIIHFTVPKSPSQTQLDAIQRTRDIHPTWEIRVWKDPVDTTGFRLSRYFTKVNSGAQLADLIRLEVVYLFGGIYLDSDVESLLSLEPLLEANNFFCSEDGTQLTNAVFGASPQNKLIDRLISELDNNEPDWTLPPNVTTGPGFFAKTLRWSPGLNLLPRDTFYPYNWNESPVDPLPTTFGVHRWEGSWLDKKASPPKPPVVEASSSLSGLKEKVKSNIRVMEARIAEAVIRRLSPRPRVYPTSGDLVALSTRNLWMSLSGGDLSITPEIAILGTYEEPELCLLERHLRGGDFFIDVGCNVGVFSLVAAKRVGPFGRVLAFDPNPIVMRHLKRSALMNWMHDRIIPQQIALGDSEREMTLHFSEARLGDGNLGVDAQSVFHRSNDMVGQEQSISVPQKMLDSIVPAGIEIKMMKIDVEGFEHSVLAGAKRIFETKQVKYLLMELLEEVSSGRHRENVSAVQRLVQFGYKICSLSPKGEVSEVPSLEAALRISRNIILARSDG